MLPLVALSLLLPSGPLALTCEAAAFGGSVVLRLSDEGAAGEVRELEARLGERTFRRERLEPGELWLLPAPEGDGRAAVPGATFVASEIELRWLEGPLRREGRLPGLLARLPDTAVPPGALARTVSYNPTPDADPARYVVAEVEGDLPEALCLRDAGANPVPATIERTERGVRIHALTDVPADYARCLFLCEGAESPPPTSLTWGGAASPRLSTGRVAVDLPTGASLDLGGSGAAVARLRVGACLLTAAAEQPWVAVEGAGAERLARELAGGAGLSVGAVGGRWFVATSDSALESLRRPPLTVVARIAAP